MQTPVQKLISNLYSEPNNKKKVVLITTGSFSPIHNIHIDILESAKTFLENNTEFSVIAGFISPSHSDYVKEKMKSCGNSENWCIPDRDFLCDVALSKSDWISVDRWEYQQPTFVDFFTVVKRLKSYLSPLIEEPFEVMYVCGEDHFVKCRLYNSENVIAIKRKHQCNFRFENNFKKNVFLVDNNNENVSSTNIRLRFSKHEYNNPVDKAVQNFLTKSKHYREWRILVGLEKDK